jgi:phosphotransferase system HPr-like phosphotransfer protein
MGLLTKMEWQKTTVLELLEDAEQRDVSDTFDIVTLGLAGDRKFLIAVISGDKAEDAYRELSDLKEGC